ncbi:DotU family type IV/VI secretion system protein [Corallococcus sp. EGB]|uniref:DotU family type IV/VI secretion system protein n=1 Tax=Corallococcus sp. EGB TaxID=1521117 RepID=UPI001CBFE29B|nr:DotU family type IV/VI secretion system protein [Corallococcus sp. EGB]
MKLEHWNTLLATQRRVRQLLDRTLPAEPAAGARRPQSRVGQEALGHLEQALIVEQERLRAAFGADMTPDEVEELIRPFVYLLDEWVLRRLADAEQHLWPLLQQNLFKVDSGGDLFYELVEEKLRRNDTPPIVFEMIRFCLAAGFTGRLVGQPERIRDVTNRISQRIPQPASVPLPAPVLPPAVPTVYDFPMHYYVATALIVLGLPVFLWWVSN